MSTDIRQGKIVGNVLFGNVEESCLRYCEPRLESYILAHASPSFSHLRGLLLQTSSTPTSPAVVGLRLVGYTVYAVVNSRIDYCNTVLAGALRTLTYKLRRVLNATARVVTGTRKFDRGLGQILHDELHWLDVLDRVFFKLAVLVHRCLDGRAPVGLLRPGRQCCHSAASAFRRPSAICTTSLPSQHLRPPCLLSRRPHSLDLSPVFHPGPDHDA